MKPDVLRNLRLVVASTLLSLWAHAQLTAETGTPAITMAALVLALVVAPGPGWRGSLRFVLVAAAGFVLLTALLYWAGSAHSLPAFGSSPWFVVPVWLLAAFGLVRNAVSAERSEALARSASAAAHAADAS